MGKMLVMSDVKFTIGTIQIDLPSRLVVGLAGLLITWGNAHK